MSSCRLAVLCIAAMVVMAAPGAAHAQKILRIGETWNLQLEGNPSTGYAWRLDSGASDGLSRVKVKSLGYADAPKRRPVMVGVPAPFGFRIRCAQQGYARLAFVYVGPTGKRARRHNVSVLCR